MKKMIFLLMMLPLIATAQSNLSPTHVNVFKNGTYFIVKEGQLPLKNGMGMMEIPAAPLQSTFWLTPGANLKITRVVFETDTIHRTKPPKNYNDFLMANKGKKIRILYQATDKDMREVAGTLQDMIASSGLVRIKQQDNKITFLPIASILELTFDENPVDVVRTDSLARVAKVYFSGGAAQAAVKLNYMQAGIQWIPSYNIKVINDKELQLEMNALVENYAEEITQCDLTLTVGNPQFLYGTKTDPLAYNYLSSLYDTRTSETRNVQFAAQMYSNAITTTDESYDLDYVDYTVYTTDGEKTHDLYMYKIGQVNLPMHSKTHFQVFSAKIPYKDVYEVSIADVANYSGYGYNISDPEKRYDVYHSFKLTNSTQSPFTTGPVFVQDEKLQPIAQDLVKYTAVGGNVSVQLSKAGDVLVKNKEEEVSKTDNVKKLGRTYYNKVVVKGSVQIENLQDKKISLNVEKQLTALVTEVSSDGKILKSGKYNALNPYTTIEWEVPLNANEKKTLTYQYEVYVSASLGY